MSQSAIPIYSEILLTGRQKFIDDIRSMTREAQAELARGSTRLDVFLRNMNGSAKIDAKMDTSGLDAGAARVQATVNNLKTKEVVVPIRGDASEFLATLDMAQKANRDYLQNVLNTFTGKSLSIDAGKFNSAVSSGKFPAPPNMTITPVLDTSKIEAGVKEIKDEFAGIGPQAIVLSPVIAAPNAVFANPLASYSPLARRLDYSGEGGSRFTSPSGTPYDFEGEIIPSGRPQLMGPGGPGEPPQTGAGGSGFINMPEPPNAGGKARTMPLRALFIAHAVAGIATAALEAYAESIDDGIREATAALDPEQLMKQLIAHRQHAESAARAVPLAGALGVAIRGAYDAGTQAQIDATLSTASAQDTYTDAQRKAVAQDEARDKAAKTITGPTLSTAAQMGAQAKEEYDATIKNRADERAKLDAAFTKQLDARRAEAQTKYLAEHRSNKSNYMTDEEILRTADADPAYAADMAAINAERDTHAQQMRGDDHQVRSQAQDVYGKRIRDSRAAAIAELRKGFSATIEGLAQQAVGNLRDESDRAGWNGNTPEAQRQREELSSRARLVQGVAGAARRFDFGGIVKSVGGYLLDQSGREADEARATRSQDADHQARLASARGQQSVAELITGNRGDDAALQSQLNAIDARVERSRQKYVQAFDGSDEQRRAKEEFEADQQSGEAEKQAATEESKRRQMQETFAYEQQARAANRSSARNDYEADLADFKSSWEEKLSTMAEGEPKEAAKRAYAAQSGAMQASHEQMIADQKARTEANYERAAGNNSAAELTTLKASIAAEIAAAGKDPKAVNAAVEEGRSRLALFQHDLADQEKPMPVLGLSATEYWRHLQMGAYKDPDDKKSVKDAAAEEDAKLKKKIDSRGFDRQTIAQSDNATGISGGWVNEAAQALRGVMERINGTATNAGGGSSNGFDPNNPFAARQTVEKFDHATDKFEAVADKLSRINVMVIGEV